MTYITYVATSPSGCKYVGITNNFKRRLKEHLSSPYPFGKALRKYGKNSFNFQLIECKSLEEAYELEELAITEEEVKSKRFYNISCGGRADVQLSNNNPMKNPEIVAKHPKLFTSEYNPMLNPESKAKAMKSNEKYKKRVMICGVEYAGVREAARQLGFSRQKLVHRLKSKTFKDHYYL